MSKKEFIGRAILWSILAAGLPIAFIGWRYDLFKTVGTLQLSGWGSIALIILIAFAVAVAKYVKAGMAAEWSMGKQIATGIIKVLLPLGALYAVCVAIRANIDYFIQALGCAMICEAAAIPANPFPKWVWLKSKGRFESAVDYVADRLNRGKGGE